MPEEEIGTVCSECPSNDKFNLAQKIIKNPEAIVLGCQELLARKLKVKLVCS